MLKFTGSRGHHGRLLGSSSVKQQQYDTPLYVKGRMQALPDIAVCRQEVVGVVVMVVVDKTQQTKERKLIREQQIISLTLEVFNMQDPRHYPDLGSACDCLRICFNQLEALPGSGQSQMRPLRHQYGISAVVASRNARLARDRQ